MATLGCLSTTTIEIKANEKSLEMLIDTGSTENFINAKIEKENQWKTKSDNGSFWIFHALLQVKGTLYKGVRYHHMKDLYCNLILGHDFLRLL